VKLKQRGMLAVTAALTASVATFGGLGASAMAKSVKHDSAPVSLQEAGSSLIFPLFQLWQVAYKSVAPNVNLTPAAGGSGAGISQASAGTVQIGASDAYMSRGQLAKSPDVLNIPLSVSAQQIMYNLPSVSKKTHLKLTGNLLADIFLNKIHYWDAPQIKALNKGVRLPHWLIYPIHRADGSGDTFLFTTFLSDTSAQWANSVGYNTTVNWPTVKYAPAAAGNAGIVQTASQTPGSISYVGISWLDKGTAAGLGEAQLQNKAGNFILPTHDTILAAANATVNSVPKDERVSLIYAPGANSYPIINFEYAIVKKQQSSTAVADAVKNLLLWAISAKGGNQESFLTQVHFLPLPAKVEPLSKAQINSIHG
jgi:phosphate transport system substrate-binding protein